MLNTKSFLCCRIIHGRPLFKRNQTWLKDFNGLLRGSSKRHCIFEKDYQGPRLPCLAKSCHMMLATYHHMCWASKQTIEEFVLHWLHQLQGTMRATVIIFHRNLSMSLFHCHCSYLVDNWPKKSCFFLRLMLVPNDVPTWRGMRKNFIMAMSALNSHPQVS
jgi:hypothetical protein